MKNLFSTFVILIFFSLNLMGQNIGDSPQTKLGFTINIHSKHLNDSINIFIHHPFNYKANKKFPVVLLLDANSSFKSFSACTELMAYDRSIPTCIVVGFPQYKYAEFDSINLSNKMDKLAQFISGELFIYLESKYNITKSIVWGQGKQSGLITSYLMLEYPDLFNGYISDTPDLRLIHEKAYSKNAFDKLQDKKLSYYLFGSSLGDALNEPFLKNLKANAPVELNWNYHVSDEKNWIINILDNYMHAIEMFFNDKVE